MRVEHSSAYRSSSDGCSRRHHVHRGVGGPDGFACGAFRTRRSHVLNPVLSFSGRPKHVRQGRARKTIETIPLKKSIHLWFTALGYVCAAAALPACHNALRPAPVPVSVFAPSTRQLALADTVEERTVRWFWETTDSTTGLSHDRWPQRDFSSIASIGFALTAYPVGAERGWITRAQAAERTLVTLRYLWQLPQGPEAQNMGGYKGFFYHFLRYEDGRRFDKVELSTIDTALLLGGVLFAQSYYTGADATQTAIRAIADSLYKRVDWAWFCIRRRSSV